MSNGVTKPVMNINTRRYKHGSIIYFEGDRSDYIYILKTGRVILTSIKIDTGEEVKENIKIGEFFGVKSAIGRYPREETAQTIGDVTVLVVNRADFEKLILKNVELVTKMLRVFSNQLRRIGKMQREILGETDTINPAAELFKIGEYYYKSGSTQQALYCYKRYLEHYPNTKFSDLTMQRIRAIKTGNTDLEDGFSEKSGSSKLGSADEDRNNDISSTYFSIEEESDLGPGLDEGISSTNGSSSQSSIASEIYDFFPDDDKGDFNDFSFDESPSGKDITEIFYEAASQFSQDNYNDSLSLYKEILGITNLKNDSEKNIYEKAHFEIGRCYLKLGKYNEGINSLSEMIKKFPKSNYIKNAFFHIAIAFEMTRKIDEATTYLKKVISMEPKDSINKLAMKRLSSLQNRERR